MIRICMYTLHFHQACLSSTWYRYFRFGWWNWIQLFPGRARCFECLGCCVWPNWRNCYEVCGYEISPSFDLLWRAPSTLQCFAPLGFLSVGTRQSSLRVLPKPVRSEVVYRNSTIYIHKWFNAHAKEFHPQWYCLRWLARCSFRCTWWDVSGTLSRTCNLAFVRDVPN